MGRRFSQAHAAQSTVPPVAWEKNRDFHPNGNSTRMRQDEKSLPKPTTSPQAYHIWVRIVVAYLELEGCILG